MTEPTGTDAGGEAVAASADTSELTLTEAGALLEEMLKEPEAGADDATPEQKSDPQGNDASPAKAAGEKTTDADDAALEVPPIEKPRSWPKDMDDVWSSLPREVQDKLAPFERERDSGANRKLQEVAEARKAAETAREKAEQVRTEYEAKLPALLQTLHSQGPFADIKTFDDVRTLQKTDPFRFQEYQLYSAEMQVYQNELQQAEARKQTEAQAKWSDETNGYNAKFAEQHPEYSDPKKKAEISDRAASKLKADFSDQELSDLASGKSRLSIFHPVIQSLLLDSLKLEDLQKAKTAVLQKTVPAVQRPGTSRPAGAEESATIQALEAKLNRTGSIKDAEALLNARENARQRRAS